MNRGITKTISKCRECQRGGRITFSRYEPRGFKVICTHLICPSRKRDKDRAKWPTKLEAVKDWNELQEGR